MYVCTGEWLRVEEQFVFDDKPLCADRSIVLIDDFIYLPVQSSVRTVVCLYIYSSVQWIVCIFICPYRGLSVFSSVPTVDCLYIYLSVQQIACIIICLYSGLFVRLYFCRVDCLYIILPYSKLSVKLFFCTICCCTFCFPQSRLLYNQLSVRQIVCTYILPYSGLSVYLSVREIYPNQSVSVFFQSLAENRIIMLMQGIQDPKLTLDPCLTLSVRNGPYLQSYSFQYIFKSNTRRTKLHHMFIKNG